MDDALEKFIKDHRVDFDSEEPGKEVWNNIQTTQTKTGFRQVWWKVAAVFFMLTTSYLIYDSKFQVEDTASNETELSEFAQVEAFYASQISQKKAELSQYGDVELQREFLMEVERLDAAYAQLKETFEKQYSTQLLTDAMINNLKLRIDILNQQLNLLRSLKMKTQNENESQYEI